MLQTQVIRHVGDIAIYESDLKTLGPKHAVNDKVRHNTDLNENTHFLRLC